jgi:hypothetical protein
MLRQPWQALDKGPFDAEHDRLLVFAAHAGARV